MTQVRLQKHGTQQARQERSRMLLVMRELEDALAAASTTRERRWVQRVRETLLELQTALRETRQAADSRGSLLDQLVDECPRLQGRAERLRAEYDKLQQIIRDLLQKVDADGVEIARQHLGSLLTKLRAVQAQETELLFEAFHVDIGIGD